MLKIRDLKVQVKLCTFVSQLLKNESNRSNMKNSKASKNEDYLAQVVSTASMFLQRKADDVMSIKQVAVYLGISEGAVRKRCQRNQLPFHRNAARLYFSKMEIDDTILGRTRLV